MKKILTLKFATVALVMSFCIAACGNAANNPSSLSPAPPANQSGSSSAQHTVNAELNNTKNQIKKDNAMSTTSSDVRVKMTFNEEVNKEVIIKIYDNPSSKDFLTLLPLTLTFKDYAGTEKISYLPRKLSTKDAPPGCTPSAQDFTYYSPWGNLAIFYKDFQYSNELIKLGKIESGMETLANMRSDFTVKIEKIN